MTYSHKRAKMRFAVTNHVIDTAWKEACISVVWHSGTLVTLQLIMEFWTYGSIAIVSLMLPFTKCKCMWPAAISMSLLAALPPKMCAFRNLMQQNACPRIIKRTFADLLPCYCYVIKTTCRTNRSRLSQPTSAGKGGDMSKLQAHLCMTL